MIIPRGWDPVGTATHAEATKPDPSVIWRPCGMCWGQGRIHEPTEYGFLIHVCDECLGVGSVAR